MTAQDIAKALVSSEKGITKERIPKLIGAAQRAGLELRDVIAALPESNREQVQQFITEFQSGR